MLPSVLLTAVVALGLGLAAAAPDEAAKEASALLPQGERSACGDPIFTVTEGGGCRSGFSMGFPTTSHGPAPFQNFPTTGCTHQRQSQAHAALVHVGKCGGLTAAQVLDSVPFNYTHVHQAVAYTWAPRDYEIYIVVTRDPVARTISAFNYQHPHGGIVKDANNLYDTANATADMYACFNQNPGGANTFAEALNRTSTCGAAARRSLYSLSSGGGLIAEGFNFYLNSAGGDGMVRLVDLLSRLRLGVASAFVVRVEHFEEDMREALQWLCLPGGVDLTAVNDGPYPRRNDTELSALASRNLRHYLAMEYQALDELYGLAVNGLRLRADSQADSNR